MVCEKLKRYLDGNGVEYEVITHSEAYTAQEIAAAMHVKGGMLVKVVMLKGESGFMMAAVAAERVLDIAKLREEMGLRLAALAREAEFRQLFPDCEPGAMPPFGNLYGVPVYVDEALSVSEYIVFQASTHYEAIKMRYADFARLVEPRVMKASRKAA
ncbi:MAG TPA: YbaK/EbsC family protein [Nitrospirota bacterium]